MGSISPDIKRLLKDCLLYVSDILSDENLSEDAEEMREVILNNFRVVLSKYPEDIPLPLDFREDDGSDDNRSSSLGRSAPSDDASGASDYQDDGGPESAEDNPLVAAQDLHPVLKQGYLEKKRKDHSFFSSEWQKRWCVISNSVFYYYGSEKDKQQKGSFYITEYSVQMVTNARRDSKKNACFELAAPGRRTFQFTASSPQEAREWVDQINFLLKDLSSNSIPCEDEEEDYREREENEGTYDDIEGVTGLPPPRPEAALAPLRHGGRRDEGEDQEEDEDIYEVVPDEDLSFQKDDDGDEKNNKPDYGNYYQGLWDCRADEPDELSFHRGDLIYIISKEYNIYGWWVGELNGTMGIVPKDFLHPAYIL
ncbi:src kinase-associated phosphoprotein 1 [Cynoglossus semilaevis]|uniref:Src kinase-associated phosphoprotein 1 n=1 Tax=Cynoglossus semilaevis TaxID=244447 RepID=A0A3P8W670_CYNSE|nr:src kinase-associated phosphoprotein 1 [Cynoglossus semilaevis]